MVVRSVCRQALKTLLWFKRRYKEQDFGPFHESVTPPTACTRAFFFDSAATADYHPRREAHVLSCVCPGEVINAGGKKATAGMKHDGVPWGARNKRCRFGRFAPVFLKRAAMFLLSSTFYRPTPSSVLTLGLLSFACLHDLPFSLFLPSWGFLPGLPRYQFDPRTRDRSCWKPAGFFARWVARVVCLFRCTRCAT